MKDNFELKERNKGKKSEPNDNRNQHIPARVPWKLAGAPESPVPKPRQINNNQTNDIKRWQICQTLVMTRIRS